jgi:hypothetical protein
VTYSSYAMLKLQESLSWMMSRRQAAMSRERASVERVGMMKSFESEGRGRLDERERAEERAAVGNRKEVRIEGIDLVR